MILIGTEKPVPSWLLRLLRTLDGLDVESSRVDVWLDVRVLAGPPVRFLVVAEPLISEERARALADHYQDAAVHRPLIATARLSGRARAILREAGISWAERETGRCRLAGPGLLLELTIRSGWNEVTDPDAHRPRRKTPPALLRDRSGLLAETLLSRAPGELLRLRTIAEDAGLSTALVSRLFGRLTRLGILEAHGRAPNKQWTLRDPGALLDRWAEEERDTAEEITGVSVWSRTPSNLIQRVSAAMNEGDLRYAFAGVAAANLYLPTLSVAPMPEFWIPADTPARDVARQLGGEVVASGANVRIWQTTGDLALRHAISRPTADPLGGTDPDAKDALAPVRIVTPYRAYIEARRAQGRGADVAVALRRTFNLVPRTPTIDPDA